MASLRGFLPSAGGTVWRNDRRSTSSSGEGDYGLSITRIKHVVIREVWKRNVPSPHALYKIDIMTQSNHWIILRRYREFYSLHQNLVKQYGIPSDMLPSKTISSSMALDHLEKRRSALEHYLQRLINSHHNIAESQELFEFLKVETHDVLCVTRHLAKVLEKEGRNILSSGSMFTFTPTQMYCITRQLQLPHCTVEPTVKPDEDGSFMDLGFLYGFIQELKHLCVSGLTSKPSLCQELISNQAFDISHFKSLEKLQIDKCHISVIDGLFRIQKQLTHITVRHSVKLMKEFLVDCATQRRAVNQANSNVEPWRNFSTTKLTENRIVVRPWILLTHVNMSHNKIVTFDHSFKLLPALEQLDLSFNDFSHLDLNQLTSSTLTFLNISHNNIHYISASTKNFVNMKSLLLSHNKLQSLDGLDCLRGLVELDIRNNDVNTIEELAKISSLLHLRILALTGNPCVAAKSHRIHVFCQMKARELILDGIKINQTEKKKVQQEQQRKLKELSPELAKCATTSNPRCLQKNIAEVDSDDDQDSGIEGNLAESIDDGGLVFNWGCYGDSERPSTSVSSQSYGGSSSRYQGAVPKRRNILSSEVNDLPVASKSESAVPFLETLRGVDKGKGPLRSKRPENRKNVCKSSARSEVRSAFGSSNFKAGTSDVLACNLRENERGDNEIRGKENKNYLKNVAVLPTRIATPEEYNPFLDNALVLPEYDGKDTACSSWPHTNGGTSVGSVRHGDAQVSSESSSAIVERTRNGDPHNATPFVDNDTVEDARNSNVQSDTFSGNSGTSIHGTFSSENSDRADENMGGDVQTCSPSLGNEACKGTGDAEVHGDSFVENDGTSVGDTKDGSIDGTLSPKNSGTVAEIMGDDVGTNSLSPGNTASAGAGNGGDISQDILFSEGGRFENTKDVDDHGSSFIKDNDISFESTGNRDGYVSSLTDGNHPGVERTGDTIDHDGSFTEGNGTNVGSTRDKDDHGSSFNEDHSTGITRTEDIECCDSSFTEISDTSVKCTGDKDDHGSSFAEDSVTSVESICHKDPFTEDNSTDTKSTGDGDSHGSLFIEDNSTGVLSIGNVERGSFSEDDSTSFKGVNNADCSSFLSVHDGVSVEHGDSAVDTNLPTPVIDPDGKYNDGDGHNMSRFAKYDTVEVCDDHHTSSGTAENVTTAKNKHDNKSFSSFSTDNGMDGECVDFIGDRENFISTENGSVGKDEYLISESRTPFPSDSDTAVNTPCLPDKVVINVCDATDPRFTCEESVRSGFNVENFVDKSDVEESTEKCIPNCSDISPEDNVNTKYQPDTVDISYNINDSRVSSCGEFPSNTEQNESIFSHNLFPSIPDTDPPIT